MTSNKELQEEEREVLMSIYDGDPAYKQLSPSTYQYKYGEDGDPRSFLVEITWGETYPEEIPAINMDTFYNKHLLPTVRTHIKEEISIESQNYLGLGMTYSLFEWVKEKQEHLLTLQPENLTEVVSRVTIAEPLDDEAESSQGVRKEKKEQLSKSQKRKQWNRMERGERPRGFDWVDVVKHLSQTGSKDPGDTAAAIVT